MKQKVNVVSPNSNSMLFAVIIGVVLSAVAGIILSIGFTSLVMNGIVKESAFKIIIFLIRVIAIIVGTVTGAKLAKENILVIAGIIALGFILLLLAFGIIIYEGSFRHFGAGIASVLTGAVIGYLISLKLQSKPQTRRKSKR